MKHRLTLGVLTLVFAICHQISSQSWIDKRSGGMKFSDVADEYYTKQGDTITTRSVGAKPFRRWLHRYESRIDESGKIEGINKKYEIYNDWQRAYQKTAKRSITPTWVSEGPNSTPSGYYGLGRVNCIGFHPSNNNIIYMGAAGGGLWKSTTGGTSWIPLTDHLGSLGVSSIAIRSDNPNIIYIATGDFDGYDNNSIGVLRSNDGGTTWINTGLTFTTSQEVWISKIVIHPQNNDIIIASTNLGIYVSNDGGTTWNQTLTGSLVFDLEINPFPTSNTVFAGGGTNIWKSTDRGQTWAIVHTATSTNRIALSIAPSDTNYIYGIFSNSTNSGFSKLSRSTNNGVTWTTRSTSPNILNNSIDGSGSGGQGWYDLAIAVSPSNRNVVNIGGINHWQSTNGGTNWTLKSHWASGNVVVHADKHALEYQGSVLWEGNDGGIYKSLNGGTAWTDMSNGLAIGQIYRIDVAQSYSRSIIGLQDNGTINNGNDKTWINTIGGDGMKCTIHPSDGNIMYGASQYGNLYGSRNGGESWTRIRSNITTSNGSWITPHNVNYQNPKSAFVGYKSVFKTNDNGDSWTNIGNNLINSSTNLTHLEISRTDSLTIFAGTNSVLRKTINGGASWSTLAYPGTAFNITNIHISPTSSNIVWVSRSNYLTDSAKVYISINGGVTWQDITYDLPDIPARALVHHGGRLYVGMDVGIYYLEDGSNSWVLFNNGLPNAEIADLKVSVNENKLYAATYGRGVWSVMLDPVMCPVPDLITIGSIDTSSAVITWGTMPSATGYEWIVKKGSSFPTTNGILTGSTSAIQSGLTYGPYHAFVRSVCGVNKSNWVTSDIFTTVASCGDTIYDPGGKNDRYYDLAYKSYLIKPTAGKVAKLKFDFINIEEAFDALYIYDGPNNSFPKISSGNPATLNNYFPVGAYYGTQNIGNFGSMAPFGELFLEFFTDDFVSEEGWSAKVSCVNACPTEVDTKRDFTFGSIRHTLSCNTSGIVSFSTDIVNDTLVVDNTIVLSQSNLALLNTLPSSVIIKYKGLGSVFSIPSGMTFSLEKITIISTNNNVVIDNQGILNLKNITIIKSNPNAQSINNKGVLNMTGNNKI
jgi:photosystem II stability/assembly factor-like uncharacterized protein